MKKISILGSTGSIGTQALDVIRRHNNNYNIVGLSGNTNIELLEKQALEFEPNIISVGNKKYAQLLKQRIKKYDLNINIVDGIDGLTAVATEPTADIILTSVVGMIGLQPTLEAIKKNKTIALANKETLVTAGELVMKKAREHNVMILPVDSEHSAIFQSLQSGKHTEIKKLILTASGGPFRGKNRQYLKNVKPKDALKHPNWSMGKKISIDSATLMNKGLEVIEAKWLFNIDISNIEVLVHPQSIIHSMVEYIDGNIIAQLGVSDMRIPIQYSLTYPNRNKNNIKSLNLKEIRKLTFEEPDTNTFHCFNLAINAIKEGGTMPSVLNAANEVAVDLFLKERIYFTDIDKLIEQTMLKHNNITSPSLNDILQSDKWARNKVLELSKN